jgi:hypothetical protein
VNLLGVLKDVIFIPSFGSMDAKHTFVSSQVVGITGNCYRRKKGSSIDVHGELESNLFLLYISVRVILWQSSSINIHWESQFQFHKLVHARANIDGKNEMQLLKHIIPEVQCS